MVTALDFMVKQEWLKAIHENDNKFYVVYLNAAVSDCVSISILHDLGMTPYKARQPIKYKLEHDHDGHVMTYLGIKQTTSLRDKGKRRVPNIPSRRLKKALLMRESNYDANFPTETVKIICATAADDVDPVDVVKPPVNLKGGYR
ncbi:11160_t:CDS:2 [Paraglomus occultum]|uniref:11160_t:CDS:1 n=1 Tax=Paraglomus occultum TaxID=144539 RepID=A0A9N9C1K0_9GLOM|nr:11160_t:CDS:2 [Paraglomus occultum]